MFVLIGLAMLVQGVTGTPTNINPNVVPQGECQQWASDLGEGHDSIVMHYIGCDDASGVYERVDGYCGAAARRAYRKGLEGEAFNVYVGNAGDGCVLAEDGSWLPE